MSIYVRDFSTTPWSVVHDDASGGAHTGTVDPTTIVHTTDISGVENHNYLMITCPVCQAVSTHPVGGGAQPQSVQQMFVNKCQSDGCVCPEMLQRGAMTPQAAVDHVRELVEAMDGPERWQLDESALVAGLGTKK